jgi:adenylate kinase
MALNLVMLGAPGAGKGTQAERLAHARGIPRVSTGDILREAVHQGTDVGQRAKADMDRGELVSDELIIGIVRERLNQVDAANGFVLDGFPRNVAQAVALDDIMDGRSPLIVIDIAVPEPELVRRLAFRLVCEDCGITADPGEGHGPDAGTRRCHHCGGHLAQRSDDNEAVVRKRLKIYGHDTKPLIDYYRPRPTFRSIDGAQSADHVARDLAAAVEAAVGAGVVGGPPL